MGLWLLGSGAVACIKALYKPFWLDELFSIFEAKLPVSQLLTLEKLGVDPQPPLYFLTIRAFVHTLGIDSLGERLPSIIGFLLFGLCLYYFVARRTSRIYGLVALLFTGLTGCWEYAIEARGYALALACTGVAAISWQSIVLDRHRRLALVGLAVGIGLAVNFHYYSLLLVIPFVAAELVRGIQRRSLDVSVLVAIAVGACGLLPNVPILRQTRANLGSYTIYAAKPALFAAPARFAELFLTSALVPLACICGLYVILRATIYRSDGEVEDKTDRRHWDVLPDVALLFALAFILPLSAIVAGKLATHVLIPRYIMDAMFGVIGLVGFSLWFVFHERILGPVMVCALFSIFVLHSWLFDLQYARDLRDNSHPNQLNAEIPRAARHDQLPIATVDHQTALEMRYYLPSTLGRRVVFLSDKASEQQYWGWTQTWWAVVGSAPFFGTQIADYKQFVKQNKTFYVLAPTVMLKHPGWLIPKLLEDGAQISVLQSSVRDSPDGERALFFRIQIPPTH